MTNQRSWLQHFMWIYDHRWPSTLIASLLIVVWCLDVASNILQVSGASGSWSLFATVVLSSGALLAVGVLVAFPLRWWLLFTAVKGFIKAHLVTTLTHDRVLVGIGPGGAIAVGMVAKAIRVLGYEPPSVIVVDHRYEVMGSAPSLATLVPTDFRLPAERCWIIQGYIGTGRSLQKLKEQLSLESAHVLALVISNSAELREKVDAALMVGSRNVLPWPTEAAPLCQHHVRHLSL